MGFDLVVHYSDPKRIINNDPKRIKKNLAYENN